MDKVGKNRKGPDWTRIRAEYLRGGNTYRDLASKYGVKEDTLEKRAARERWRDDFRATSGEVAEKLPGVVAAAVLDEVAQVSRDHLADLTAARVLARSLLASCESPSDLRDWATAYKSIQQCQRLALGIPAPTSTLGNPDASKAGGVDGDGIVEPPADEITAIAQYRDALG